MAGRRDFGSIFTRRNSSNYFIRFTLYGSKIERVAGPNKELAQQKLARIRVLAMEGTPTEMILHRVFGDHLDGQESFSEAAEQYMADAKSQLRPSTYRGYEVVLRRLRDAPFADMDITSIQSADLLRWRNLRKRSVSAPTANREHSIISCVFRWAMEHGLIDTNPARAFRKLSEKGREREVYLTGIESRALCRAAAEEFRPFLTCALSTGMRRGELMSLRWSAVDLERNVITIAASKAKSGRSRVIPMTSTLRKMLASLRSARHPQACRLQDYVFRQDSGSPYTGWTIRSRIAAAVAACEAIPAEKKPHVTCHVLRHTAASVMVAQGIPLYDVGKILGHSSPMVTMRYAHFAPEAGWAAIHALERGLGLDNKDAGTISDVVVRYTA